MDYTAPATHMQHVPCPQCGAIDPPSQAQLDHLKALGDDAPPPASMLEASSKIDTLLHGEGRA